MRSILYAAVSGALLGLGSCATTAPWPVGQSYYEQPRYNYPSYRPPVPSPNPSAPSWSHDAEVAGAGAGAGVLGSRMSGASAAVGEGETAGAIAGAEGVGGAVAGTEGAGVALGTAEGEAAALGFEDILIELGVVAVELAPLGISSESALPDPWRRMLHNPVFIPRAKSKS